MDFIPWDKFRGGYQSLRLNFDGSLLYPLLTNLPDLVGTRQAAGQTI